jgi:predicted ABC-type ATPase
MAEPPFLLVVAGPNGSGKTTLTDQLRADGVNFGRYINPDDIAKTLDGRYEDRVRQAQALADTARSECIAGQVSFSFETVMSHPSKIEVLRAAKAKGFRTALYFVATESADLNVRRVRQRVELDGHDVPEDRIRQRYVRTLDLLPQAIEAVDLAVLFDNTRVLRPFFRRDDASIQLQPPVPKWASVALAPWLSN